MAENEKQRFMISCWAVWRARNERVFENMDFEVEKVIYRIQGLMEEIDKLNAYDNDSTHRTPHRGVERGEGWQPPPEGVVKINVDAGIYDTKRGFGVVTRDDTGEVVWCSVLQEEGEMAAETAEAMAILWAMTKARDAGISRVVVESDCLTVVNALNNSSEGRSELFLILDDIRSLASCFESISWSHIRRIFNKAAHELAHFKPWVTGCRVWAGNIPAHILSVANADRNSIIV
ncbi:hypothetical protein vseg_001559 [Gypsophila vaccaria]